ncbi:DUF3244 domain-containing protein [Dysgonomonas sp. OttesenSCG-928-M03]|nr:DUF3244 domain-containing protein [Dysgonomonas sp. OttesenSCG-928-M03]
MKTKINLLILLSVILSFPVFSAPDKGETIGGGVMVMSVRMKVSQVMIYITERDCVEAYFTANKGIVNATVTNNMGVELYSKKVDTSSEDSLNINISNLPEGSYLVMFTDATGMVLGSKSFDVY